ncbi:MULTISPECIES: hypothetical protein [unclassified Bradyrhizobium]|uniref:hypothetical protein n=1 Tax=unclassified Bradyrhizobium TaxID=2631580 RepID=UPI001FFF739D|nr:MULTISPECIES: hypothetical protein [unclassified Bradyrhizobium]UPJ29756.1 hypothetical protein IVB54_12450 [Bradyrhizobium sp. CW1]UPJ82653.1 hypothetical protein IVB17_12215 [Bradyrhizobium sp. 184]UPJ90447.1 hypothetical protein IVB16_12215 [Bradyrhizobium sp. 183]
MGRALPWPMLGYDGHVRCATSGEYVQHRFDAESNAARASFILVQCQGCGKNHFINRVTHKLLLGHEDDR